MPKFFASHRCKTAYQQMFCCISEPCWKSFLPYTAAQMTVGIQKLLAAGSETAGLGAGDGRIPAVAKNACIQDVSCWDPAGRAARVHEIAEVIASTAGFQLSHCWSPAANLLEHRSFAALWFPHGRPHRPRLVTATIRIPTIYCAAV